MRKTIIGCAAGAAAILALAACSNSAAPAAAPSTTAPRTTPPAVVAAPSITSPATTTGCTALMAGWYDGSGPSTAASGTGDGKDAVSYFRDTWSSVIPPGATTLAEQHAAAHGLLGGHPHGSRAQGRPPGLQLCRGGRIA
jgi:hypothetical protein